MVIDINKYITEYEKFYNKDIEINYDFFCDNTIMLLENLTNKQIDEILYYTWERIIQTIPNGYLTPNIIEYLLEHEIAFDILCYKDLTDEQLIKIYNKNKCIDALIILGKKLLSNDEYTVLELCQFINENNNDLLYDILLKYMIILFVRKEDKKNLYKKCINAVDVIIKQTKNDKINEFGFEICSFLSAYNEKNIDIIEDLSTKNNSLMLLALSLNPYVPDFVLEKLLFVKKFKYSKIIKSTAKERLLKLRRGSKANGSQIN
jgi:hypothetical protein